MSEPKKTQAQLDAQIARIGKAYRTAVERTEYGSSDFRTQQGRWFRATEAHGKLRGDDKKIDSFKDYRPASRVFTSRAEMDRIDKHFGLSKRNTDSLTALRNNIVEYYTKIPRQQALASDMDQWMQSLTAVIDYHIRRKGGEV